PPHAPPPPKPRRAALLVAAALVVVAAIAVTTVVLLGRETPPAEAAPVIAQYEYRFTRPDGWIQTGGNPGLLRTEIKPVGAERGDDLVLVEEKRLVFDSDTDRARAVDKLRKDFESGGAEFSDFDDKATFGGREVVNYRERLDRKEATVDWYVLYQGKAQVSVGCQYTESGRDKVRGACESVVRTMAIEG
ncbi:type VII secretion-associated protein, partial [Actinokineospora sp.]|uniref:type VII secretion-associated protein n=1 Tax=Actinokineospora sp. TaxID=1872133 RepID=UPI003D6ACA90